MNSGSRKVKVMDVTDVSGVYAVLALIACVLVYFFPYGVALGNKKKNADAIGLLNLFLGWTGLGWIIALVWAACKD